MWVMTPYGFTSAVAHRTKKNYVLVRARDKESLEYFCDFAGLKRNKVFTDMPSDYPFRVVCKRKTYEQFLLASARDITYDNFKNRAGQVRGKKGYVDFLMRVWSAGHMLTPADVTRANNSAWARHDSKWWGGSHGSFTGVTPDVPDVTPAFTLDDFESMEADERAEMIRKLEDAEGSGDDHATTLLDEIDALLAKESGDDDTRSIHEMTDEEWAEYEKKTHGV